MAEGELQRAVVDVPIGSLNTIPPDHAGPTGRLTQLFDAVIKHYDSSNGKRTLIEPRDGFLSLTSNAHNYLTSASEVANWTNPSFLFALGDQLLSICSNIPRVYNGIDWTNYGTTRVVTQKLSERTLHASNSTIAACDHAWLTGVTCAVWTEQVNVIVSGASQLNTSVWVGFRADDGAWVRVPNQLRSAIGSDPDYVMAKVVTDGLNFWVVYNLGPPEAAQYAIKVYNTTGLLLASAVTARNWTTAPGYFDIYASATVGGMLLAQPQSYTATQADVHVNAKKFTYATGTITQAINSNLSSAHCTGPVNWLTNDLSGTSVYLGTVGTSAPPAVSVWVYELNASLAQTHEYAIDTPFMMPDSITGWAEESGVGGQRNVYVSYSMLASQQSSGPPFDPALRTTTCIKCTFGGATSTQKFAQSVIQQSRAFAIGSEYHVYSYYQSGSGQALPAAASSVTWTSGDYFVGASSQPMKITGGFTSGASFPGVLNPSDPFIAPKVAMSAKNIDGAGTPDSVQQISSSGFAAQGIPDGTLILKWTFKNATFSATDGGSILSLSAGASIGASTTWDIIIDAGAGTIAYTPLINRSGGTITPGNFTTSGTVSVTATVYYPIPNIGSLIAGTATALFTGGGTITVSGASNGGNNGSFGIVRVSRTAFGAGLYVGIWTLKSTQVFEDPTAATTVIAPAVPRLWTLSGDSFTTIDQQSTLVVTDDTITTNNGTYGITATSGNTVTTGNADAAATVGQFFTPPVPTFSLSLNDDSTQYTVKLQSVTFTYKHIGGLMSISNASHASVNGVYKITAIIDSHTVRVTPTNGTIGQRSESFANTIVIAIQLATFVQPQTQPTWFVTPLTGSQPQVGCFERGLAYADWRFDGQTSASPDFDAQDRYRFALSSTSQASGTIRRVVLPFRASSFTQVSIATVGATPIDIANASSASTVGLKIFDSDGHGEGTGDAGKLMLPGLLAGEFTASGFAEHNYNVGPEAPFIVSQGHDSGTTFALTAGQTYTYQLIATTTLENGDVVESIASPAIQVTLTGNNNFAVIGGRLLAPLDATGALVAGRSGVTNHAQTTYAISRSVVVNGTPSTQLHLVTNPANPNGLYTSGSGSGFSFPDNFTWNYRDENPDAGIQATQVISQGTLGQGEAPHYAAPAFHHATTWANRRWVAGYDGAVWMSSEILEGQEPWFFPGFRYPFPEEDPAVCVVGFENFLYILCAKSIWRVPFAELPNNTLTAGSMPTPIRMPFDMGCSGFAVAMSDAVAYSSSASSGKQIWAITRNLANIYLSEPIVDFMTIPVSGMCIDGLQRLIVLAGTGGDTVLRVFDPVAQEWSLWNMPTAPNLICSYLGQPTYEDGAFVVQQHEGSFADNYNSFITNYALDLTFSSFTFAQVRAVKRLWEAQIVGTRNGACNINAIINYPFSFNQPATVFGPTLLPTNSDMLMAINPAIEDAGEFQIRIFGSYEGVSVPGRAFSLELLSCEVGLDPRQGLKKLPDGFRIVGA